MNPYFNTSFFHFLLLFINRMGALLQGKLAIKELATDEIQILVLMGIAISSAFVGTFLILRRMTMLANALSHTILIGIAIAILLIQGGLLSTKGHRELISSEILLIAALLTGLATTFLTEIFTKLTKLQEDASIGLIFTSLFALGIVLVTLFTRSSHIGIEAVMGNADALHLHDLQFIFFLSLVNLLLFLIFFKEYLITTFDPHLAIALGISSPFFNYLLMAQVSATTIGAFRAVGVLMVLAFITGPVLTARLITDRLKSLLLLSSALGCLASIIGVALARHLLTAYGLGLSTSGVVVCTIVGLFLLTVLITRTVPIYQKMKSLSS